MATPRIVSAITRLNSSTTPSSPPQATHATTPSPQQDYTDWDREALLHRVTDLEQQLRHQTSILSKKRTPSPPIRKADKQSQRNKRQFDPTKYNTRYIALRLSYLGHRYSGFEHHANSGPRLPAIEEELWKALAKVKLIFPTGGTDGEVTWEGCEYSKCGRTDKGVSAFGQVIVLRVRSSRPLRPWKEVVIEGADGTERVERQDIQWDPIKDELAYPRMLNRVLPDDIRVHAWCAAPSLEFSARFSCKERRYRYFFTQPAFAPRPGRAGINDRGQRDGWVDVDAMRKAAGYFVGLHDFRNFCKVDPSKQITNFQRRVFVADIKESTSSTGMPDMLRTSDVAPHQDSHVEARPTVLEFQVSGSGFLWHQVRHMVAVLFLVGQGLEKPEIIKELLNVEQEPKKPHYEMADDAPLVLWECVFPSETGDQHTDALDWIYPEDQVEKGPGATMTDGRYGPTGLVDSSWSEWRRRKIDDVLAGSLLDVVAGQGRVTQEQPDASLNGHSSYHDLPRRSTKVFHGGNTGVFTGQYTSLLEGDRHLSVEELNQRYLVRKGIPARPDHIVTPGSSEETDE